MPACPIRAPNVLNRPPAAMRGDHAESPAGAAFIGLHSTSRDFARNGRRGFLIRGSEVLILPGASMTLCRDGQLRGDQDKRGQRRVSALPPGGELAQHTNVCAVPIEALGSRRQQRRCASGVWRLLRGEAAKADPANASSARETMGRLRKPRPFLGSNAPKRVPCCPLPLGLGLC